MGVYSIKDLEQLSGIKAHTIRIWEQRYQLIEPKRTDTNIRYYDDQQLKFLLNVALLIKNGHKISHISKLSEDKFNSEVERVYEQTLLHDSDIHLDLDANDLVVAMIDMDADKFGRIYENSVRHNGFEKTITQVIYPFLEKVGILWSLDQINPAHEHFISSLIRQKVIAAIDRLPMPKDGKKVILFLPAGEHHEIGLLMAHYVTKKRGHRTYYLGQNLPDKDVDAAVLTIEPDFVLTFLVEPSIVNNAKSTIENLKSVCNDCDLLIATRLHPDLEGFSMDRVHLLHGIDDIYKYL